MVACTYMIRSGRSKLKRLDLFVRHEHPNVNVCFHVCFQRSGVHAITSMINVIQYQFQMLSSRDHLTNFSSCLFQMLMKSFHELVEPSSWLFPLVINQVFISLVLLELEGVLYAHSCGRRELMFSTAAVIKAQHSSMKVCLKVYGDERLCTPSTSNGVKERTTQLKQHIGHFGNIYVFDKAVILKYSYLRIVST